MLSQKPKEKKNEIRCTVKWNRWGGSQTAGCYSTSTTMLLGVNHPIENIFKVYITRRHKALVKIQNKIKQTSS